MKPVILPLIIITATFLSPAANASQSNQDKNLSSDNLSINISSGWLTGQAKEYVYWENNSKLSELDWEIKSTPIIRGDISWNTTPWLTLEANGWITLRPSHSTMHDFDWMIPNQTHWSHLSYSPNTRLNYANEFNINSNIWLMKKHNFKLAGVIGYQQTQFDWTAIGGYYDYNNGQEKGELPPIPGIAYDQKLSVPYIGSKIQYKYKNWEFNALLKYSPWVLAMDNDEHYLRQLNFIEKTHNSEYYSVRTNLGYYITPQMKFFSEWIWNKYTQGKGRTNVNGIPLNCSNCAGIENRNYQFLFGIAYQF